MNVFKNLSLVFLTISLISFSMINCLYNSNSPVVKLDESNFDKLVTNGEGIWLVEFFAPWCGHCKNLAPEWEKAARALKGIVNVGAVDVDTHKSFGGRFGINGFPTIKYFGANKKNPVNYEQGRTANDIVKFALQKVNEVVQERLGGKSTGSNSNNQSNKSGASGSGSGSDKDVIVLEDSTFDKEVYGSTDMWLIEFYAPWCGHCKSLEPEWNKAATELKGKIKVAKVDATANNQLSNRFGVRGYPTIKIFPPGKKSDNNVEAYEGGRTSDVIVATALEKLEKFGFIPDTEQLLSQDQYKKECIDAGRTCVIAFLPNMYESSAKERNRYLDIYKKSSSVGRGKPMTFLWIQGSDNFEIEEKVGVSFNFPAVVVINSAKKKYSVMRDSYELENIKTYLNRVLIGRESLYDLPKLPQFKTVPKWDGKDAELPVETNDDL